MIIITIKVLKSTFIKYTLIDLTKNLILFIESILSIQKLKLINIKIIIIVFSFLHLFNLL